MPSCSASDGISTEQRPAAASRGQPADSGALFRIVFSPARWRPVEENEGDHIAGLRRGVAPQTANLAIDLAGIFCNDLAEHVTLDCDFLAGADRVRHLHEMFDNAACG